MDNAKQFGSILFEILELLLKSPDQVAWTHRALREIEANLKVTPPHKLFQSGMFLAAAGLAATIEEGEKPKRRR